MSGPLIDTPPALDSAIAASLQVSREKLVRAIRNQRLRARMAFGLSGCVALLALAAFFVAHDIEASAVIAMMAFLTFGLTCWASKLGRNKVVNELREMDQGANSRSLR
jgi:hypothetical protein